MAIKFLTNMKNLVGTDGAMIIGIDQIKNTQTLINAYDDSLGVTADFNKNLLVRINNELNGNFDIRQFEHKAIFDQKLSRIEIHLVSKKKQVVFINGIRIKFDKGESIHTENSHKYSDQSFLELVSRAGLKSVESWSDKNKFLGIHYLEPLS